MAPGTPYRGPVELNGPVSDLHCNCWCKSPTVPLFRDAWLHLEDCPLKGSGTRVGTNPAGLTPGLLLDGHRLMLDYEARLDIMRSETMKLHEENARSLEVLQTAYTPTPTGDAPLSVLARWAAVEVLMRRERCKELARLCGCLEPNEEGHPSCDPPCIACQETGRVAP